MTRDEIASLTSSAIVWDGLDDAIIGLAKRENLGPLVIYDTNGVIDINLDPYYYDVEIEEDEDLIDNWGRDSFDNVVAYDVEKAIRVLMKEMEVSDDEIEDGMSRDDVAYQMATEYFSYNVAGAFVGDKTPIHLVLEEKE